MDTGDNEDWETDSDSSIASDELGSLTVDTYELTLHNGSRVGHRTLARYYKQNVRHKPVTTVNRSRAITQYGERAKEMDEQLKGRKRFEEHKRREDFITQMAFKNNSQKHYRDQLLQ